MRRYTTGRLDFGAPLALTFVLLVAFILGGNGLLIWQFRIARQQTDRLAVMSRRMMAILRLENKLVSFHQNLDELVASQDASALLLKSQSLQRDLLEQVQQTREVLNLSVSARSPSMRFLPILDAIEIGFPHQLEAITSLAKMGDWEAVKDRVAVQLKPTEIEVTALAQDIDEAFTAELSRSELNTRRLQNRILILIPFMALSTFSIAALFVWVIARRVIQLKLEERLHERMRITRDLHDTFLQTVQGSKLFAQNTLAKCSDPEGMRDAIAQLAQWLNRAGEEGRSALNSLRTAQEDRDDFVDALQAIIMDTKTQGPMDVVLSVSGNPIEASPEVQEEVLRISREAITNARKHSRGSQAEVKLEYAGSLSITISDNGKGLDRTVSAAALNGHYGLKGMHERAAHIGGKLTITSSETSGTQLRLVVPRRSLRQSPGSSAQRFIGIRS
jgi:signal transduction histidine kinase